jgi:hypothetical protein
MGHHRGRAAAGPVLPAQPLPDSKAIEVNPRSEPGRFAVALRDAAKVEAANARHTAAAHAYRTLEKPSVNGVALLLGVGWSTAKRYLQLAGVRLNE